MMTNRKKKTWKDALLKSSLPLELLVAEKLDQLGFYVFGEYSYLRENENGLNTEFSVDINASYELRKDQEKQKKKNFLQKQEQFSECHPFMSTLKLG